VVTVSRKLAIITPTPMAAATAIVSAAIATEVRESAATMPRVARRPSNPNVLPATRWAGRRSTTATAGVNSAPPTMLASAPRDRYRMPPAGQSGRYFL
jgi:hypothetical protein